MHIEILVKLKFTGYRDIVDNRNEKMEGDGPQAS